MRATACLLLTMLAVAGCGGDDAPLPVSGPVGTPTPPPAEELKFDMVTAERLLDEHRLTEGAYTADETLLSPAFPRTITVKEAGVRSFYMAAYDDQGIRYAMVKEDDEVERTCDPPDAVDCPEGEW